MTHEEKNIGGRAEHPGSDEQKISQMLGSLKRVEAPKDFDFHLKARIANAKPSDYQRSGLLSILKYAMPLALFLVVGAGAVGISSFNTWQTPPLVEGPKSGNETVAVAANADPKISVPETIPPPQPADETKAPVNQTREPILAANPKVTSPRPDVRTKSQVEEGEKRPGGGSVRFGGGNPTKDKETICVTGMPCTNREANDALTTLGIEASYEGGAWTVKSVKANNVAGQLGVKPGDKLKSIDGLPLTDRSTFNNVLTVKTIQVQRGKETIDLTINDKPK